ncbi:MAG: exodeoxyribonuclease VII small subunit [Rhodospirillales bacterium]
MAKDKTAGQDAIPDDIARMSFEAALEELEDIVRELETGDGDLDTSINGYTRGVFLKKHCEMKLKEAEARIEKIVVGSDGSVATEPLDDA